MAEDTPDSTDRANEKPGLRTLVRELGADAKLYAEAEARYLKVAAEERISYATPGVILLVGAASLGAGALVALLFGLMVVITPSLGPALATVAVVAGALAVAGLLGWAGRNRLAAAMKRPEER